MRDVDERVRTREPVVSVRDGSRACETAHDHLMAEKAGVRALYVSCNILVDMDSIDMLNYIQR